MYVVVRNELVIYIKLFKLVQKGARSSVLDLLVGISNCICTQRSTNTHTQCTTTTYVRRSELDTVYFIIKPDRSFFKYINAIRTGVYSTRRGNNPSIVRIETPSVGQLCGI